MSATTEANAPSAAAPVIDLETLLAPIPGGSPVGESLQYSGIHDEIREARRSEDTFDQGEWKHEPKVANWHQVETLASEALAARTKDLQVCSWLAEALIKLHGFGGLRDGLRLMRGLLENFWEKVYPEMDEGDLEARANSLAWMNRQTALALKEVAVTRGGDSYLRWEESRQFDISENLASLDAEAQERIAGLQARAAEEGKFTGEEWRKAKSATPRAFYEEIYALLKECRDEFQALDRVMDEKFGRQTPGLGELKKALEDVYSLVEKIVKEKRIAEPDSVEVGEGDGSKAVKQAEDAIFGGSAGPVRSRQEALRKLAEVADYFRRTEPHSPVSYLVQRAIQWGQMPLDAWLADVIKDGGVLSHLRETLGLGTAADGGREDES
jgi:type VI secretion system protein ImpA